jgi:hypothetical protein
LQREQEAWPKGSKEAQAGAMMKVWFMYDRHQFAQVGDSQTSRQNMEARAKELFAEDGCGSLFARTVTGMEAAACNGKPMADGTWGADADELRCFFDAVDEHINWECR